MDVGTDVVLDITWLGVIFYAMESSSRFRSSVSPVRAVPWLNSEREGNYQSGLVGVLEIVHLWTSTLV